MVQIRDMQFDEQCAINPVKNCNGNKRSTGSPAQKSTETVSAHTVQLVSLHLVMSRHFANVGFKSCRLTHIPAYYKCGTSSDQNTGSILH